MPIKEKVWELFKEISSKMYNPARAKYEYVSLTQTFNRLFNTKQEEEELLIDYTKWFKQAQENFAGIVGKDLLHKFAINTRAYKEPSHKAERRSSGE